MQKTAVVKNNRNKIHIGSRWFDAALIIFMILFSVVMLYPFLNVVSVSLSSNAMIASGKVTWYPKQITIVGYQIMFEEGGIFRAYWNTIIIAIGSTIATLSVNTLMAYVLMPKEFVFRKPITILMMITMFFGGGTVPTYLLIRQLGLMNTYWALMLPGAFSAYNVFVYRAYFNGISPELREAAKIDGASEFKILWNVYVPLSKALYATYGLFAIVGAWNSYMDALLYIKDQDRQPIQMLLRRIVFTSGVGNMETANDMITTGELNAKNVQYACIVLTMGPILLVYPFLQKYFVKGVQVGAVKG